MTGLRSTEVCQSSQYEGENIVSYYAAFIIDAAPVLLIFGHHEQGRRGKRGTRGMKGGKRNEMVKGRESVCV